MSAMTPPKYPLCEALGLRPRNEDGNYHAVTAPYVFAHDLERVLREAPVVYGVPGKHFSHADGYLGANGCIDTHTARLLCIQPIVRDRAEEIYQLACTLMGKESPNKEKFMRECRKLLGKEG